jgi:hypothetical protein
MATSMARRDFLKCTGAAAVPGATGIGSQHASGAEILGTDVTQRIDEVELYMTHYALFEEPDPKVPPALYFDGSTGMPTNELLLTSPVSQRLLHRSSRNPSDLTGAPETSKVLPYVVEPPGFPPLPPPPPVVGFVQAVTGLPTPVIVSNTSILLVAMGQFLPTTPVAARLAGRSFRVTKEVHFEVRIRIGFLFQPPAGVPAPAVGILVGYLDFGLLHQLIQLPPPPNASQVVVYSWRSSMTLSTENRFVRQIATEPPPVADAFEDDLEQISFTGSHVDNAGRYTIVGHAEDVGFLAPPELVQFLFGQTSLADVEFAVQERGVLLG